MGDFSDMYDPFIEREDEEPEDVVYEDCCLITQTPLAWLIRDTVNKREAWFPKSQCDWHCRSCMIQVPHWLNPNWKDSPDMVKELPF